MGFDFGVWRVSMIKKLLNLKKMQTDQKILERVKMQNRVEELDAEIMLTQHQIATTSVNKHGAISDFAILQMHKNTMNAHIAKLKVIKNRLVQKIDKANEELKELLKESEQFGYLVQEQKKIELKELLKQEEEATNEYMQSKYVAS
jgi:chromosome segregation ATPase